MEPEILVTISFRLSQLAAMDRRALSEQLAPILKESIAVGGDKVHISLQPYDPNEEGD